MQVIVKMDKAQVNNAKLHSSYTKLTASISWRMGLRQDEQGAYFYVVTPEKLLNYVA